MKIFSGSCHPEFSNCLLKHFSKNEIGNISINRFADGEINIVVNESVRKETCFVVQPTGPSENYSPNDNLMELLITIDALKRGSAKRVIAVMPYYGYERQDRKDYSRAPISASVVARCLESVNVDRVIVYDLHAGQITGFFSNKCPVDNLYCEGYFTKYIEKNIIRNNNLNKNDIVIVAPDEGAVKQTIRISSRIETSAATIFKSRNKPNSIGKMVLMGDVKNKTAILVDDLIDTAGTACRACDLLIENGAKEVYMLACHGLFSGPALQRINASNFKKIIVSNTLPIKKNVLQNCNKIEIIDVSWLCSEAIKRQVKGQSLTELYDSNEFSKYN